MMNSGSKTHPAFKFWLETEDGYVFGPGVYSLLSKIEKKGTLKDAAISLGMSYRYAWGLIKKTEYKLGLNLITTHKGGSHGGGKTMLTEIGKQYLNEFNLVKTRLNELEKVHQLTGVIKEKNDGPDGEELLILLDGGPKVELRKGKRIEIWFKD